MTDQLLTQIAHEFGIRNSEFGILKGHSLLKAQAKDSIRKTQIRLILEPLTQELLKICGTRDKLQAQLTQILSILQEKSLSEPSYLAGNILNLLCYLQTDLSDYNLSHLTIWQADFRGVNLHRVNFQQADLSKSVFSKTFGSVYALVFSPDSQHLATGHGDGEIRLWQVETGQLLFSATGHTSSVWTLAFSPDGQTLASGGFDQTIKLWNIQIGLEYRTLQGHSDWVRGVTFSPDGKLLASCSSDQTIKIWDCSTGYELQTLRGHTAQVTTISFSPISQSPLAPPLERGAGGEGGILVSGSEDQTLRLWDVENGQCLKILEGHTSLISSVAFSADGQTLASCEEQKIKLWNLNTGECYRTLHNDLTLVWA
ncbi:MAG: pentapeptide repeat-containing protein, partial [Microcystaceae cyanobacterium]